MTTSVGEGAVRGLEAGFLMGSRVVSARQAEQDRLQRERDAEQQRTDLQEERAYQRTRQKAQDARLASQDDRQRRMDELAMLDKEAADLQAEGQGLFTQFGGYDKVPEDVRGDYTGRVRALRGRRGQLRQSFYGATVEEQRRTAAETWSRIEAGQRSIYDLGGDDLYGTLTVRMQRPLSDFLRGQDGRPSAVEQAVLDVEAGLQTQNHDLLVKGANVLLRPELTTGIGSEGPDGNEIVDKTLYDLVPHPQQPGLFVPIVQVTVRRDDGAIGRYLAPVTEDRSVYSTNAGAMPKPLSVQAALERVGQLGAMAQFVNQPDVRARLDAASPQAKASADEFLQALGAVGVAAPKAGKITRERVDLGDRIEEREVDEATGKVLGVRYLGRGLAPKVRGGSDSTGGRTGTGEQLTGEAFLKTLPVADRALVLAIAEGRAKPPELTTKDGRRLNALVQQYDPTFDGNKGGFKGEDTLRDEFVKASGDFVKIRNAYGLVQAAARDPSAGGDMALIFSFMRILDPNSVVREGEFATAQNAAGVPDRIVNLYNRVLKGERLNPTQRADFVNQAKKIYDEQQSQNEVLQGTYRDMARRYKLNPDNVVIPLGREPGRPAGQGPMALPPTARARLKEGQVTTFGNGQRWTLKNGQPVQVQ